MRIKTVALHPYTPDLAPFDIWLFLKLRGCRYETTEEMKEAVTKVIDKLTQVNFHGAFHKLLERYHKCVLSIKVPIRKTSGNLFNDPRIFQFSGYVYVFIQFIVFSHFTVRSTSNVRIH